MINFVIMRFPSTLTKSAACLLLGISAVFGSSAANAVTLKTYDLIYASDNPALPLSGSFTIDLDEPGVRNSNASGVPIWFTALTLTQTVSGSPVTYTLSQYSTISWSPKPSIVIDFNSDLKPQFNDINFGAASSGPPTGYASFAMIGNTGFNLISAAPQAVPGPLPILGIPAVLFYTRKLKKRIKARKEASGASLT